MNVAVKRPRSGSTGVIPSPGSAPVDVTKVFAPSSYWATPLAANASQLADSRVPAWLANLQQQLHLDPTSFSADGKFVLPKTGAVPGAAWFSRSTGSCPLYVPRPDEPLISVAVRSVASGVINGPEYPALHEQGMAGLPIPEGALNDPGPDESMVIWQQSTGLYADLWNFRWETGTDQQGRPYQAACDWGGVMHSAWSRSGSFRNRTVNEVLIEHENFGHTATGLALVGGVITPEEWNSPSSDSIRHALHMTVANAAQGEWLKPAHRTDGTLSPAVALPQGARLRIDPAWDLGYLNNPGPRDQLALKLATAMQRYGIFSTDKTGNGVGIRFRSPRSYEWAGLPDPYSQPNNPPWPNEIMWRLPWHRLQVLDPSVSPE